MDVVVPSLKVLEAPKILVVEGDDVNSEFPFVVVVPRAANPLPVVDAPAAARDPKPNPEVVFVVEDKDTDVDKLENPPVVENP